MDELEPAKIKGKRRGKRSKNSGGKKGGKNKVKELEVLEWQISKEIPMEFRVTNGNIPFAGEM